MNTQTHTEESREIAVLPAASTGPKSDNFDELMYAPAEAIFSAVSEGMVRLGWSVYPQERTDGRMPGRVRGATIRPISDHELNIHLPTPSALKEWNLYCGGHNVAVMLGDGSGHTISVDIDSLDQKTTDVLVDLADEILGYTPFRRQGMAPKLALIYRGAHIRSRSVKFHNAELGGLEILGAGKPLTFHGLHHKTGRYFTWLEQNPFIRARIQRR